MKAFHTTWRKDERNEKYCGCYPGLTNSPSHRCLANHHTDYMKGATRWPEQKELVAHEYDREVEREREMEKE